MVISRRGASCSRWLTAAVAGSHVEHFCNIVGPRGIGKDKGLRSPSKRQDTERRETSPECLDCAGLLSGVILLFQRSARAHAPDCKFASHHWIVTVRAKLFRVCTLNLALLEFSLLEPDPSTNSTRGGIPIILAQRAISRRDLCSRLRAYYASPGKPEALSISPGRTV